MHDRLVSRRIDALHQCFRVLFNVVERNSRRKTKPQNHHENTPI